MKAMLASSYINIKKKNNNGSQMGHINNKKTKT